MKVFLRLFIFGLLGSLLLPGYKPVTKEPDKIKVHTTLERTILTIPVTSKDSIYPYEIGKYEKYGYGRWKYGPGLIPETRIDLMPAGYGKAQVRNAALLLTFFAMTDVHITDEESPAQAILFGYRGGASSAYSPVMMYTTHVLNAAVIAVNGLQKRKPFDFGIFLGDVANCTQYNEERWFIDVLDGKKVDPDSGSKDDPVPGPGNDYQDEFQAAGLDTSIPWYEALGNHDHFWLGTNPVYGSARDLRPVFTGREVLSMGNIFTDPKGFKHRDFYMGYLNGATVYGDVTAVGKVSAFKTPPEVPSADPNRRSLTRNEWIAQFFHSTSGPVGHGFIPEDTISGFACYAFEPKKDLPLKVIVLDDTQSEKDADVHGYGHGTLDKKRYEWLVNELDKGQKEGKLMIIAAHIPIGVEPAGSYIGWWSEAFIKEADLIAKLHTYPNLLMWIAGHRHYNAVTPFVSPDPLHPELGFWQVETSSLRDFPQQFRTFGIYRNIDNTVSMRVTEVDPAVEYDSLAGVSRSYSIAAQQIFKNKLVPVPTGSCNAELVKQLSPEMMQKLLNTAKPNHSLHQQQSSE